MNKRRFKIVGKLEPRIGVVFAQCLDEGDFELCDGATLGEVSIQPKVDMPRTLDADGQIRLDVFAFFPTDSKDVEKFVVGEVVSLEIP